MFLVLKKDVTSASVPQISNFNWRRNIFYCDPSVIWYYCDGRSIVLKGITEQGKPLYIGSEPNGVAYILDWEDC